MRTPTLLLALALPSLALADSGAASRPRPPRPSPAAVCPLHAGEVFNGSYLCAQGRTALVLRVRDVRGAAVRVEFDFLHSPTRAGGRYTLTGQCTNDGRVRLDPEAWIVRPPNYIMVGMNGALDGETFRGVITHPSCGDFNVVRASR